MSNRGDAAEGAQLIARHAVAVVIEGLPVPLVPVAEGSGAPAAYAAAQEAKENVSGGMCRLRSHRATV